MRKGITSLSKICLFMFICFVFSGSNPIHSQEIDSFYLNLLQRGENSFLAGNYGDAIHQLKTSLFGLYPDKKLRAKALMYLSLCHYYIKETAQSKEYMSQAVGLLEEDGLGGLSLTERIRGEVSGLVAHFDLNGLMPEEPVPPIAEKTEPDTHSQDNPNEESESVNSTEELEKLIERNPGNSGRYYRLYDLYMDMGNRSKARKTLQKLVKAHPNEVYGMFLLGWMSFREKKYKDAESHFRQALKPRPNITINYELLEELKTYHIISVYQMGDRKRALDMMSVAVHMYTETKIRALSLSETEKDLLRKIIREYMKRSI
ncbi:MAG: tetratricopeptide repeat protein [Candidatus Aminicenantes bacterium]|nr:MAG: tetratricopeptide repeat protein [Candidatus Aminicenantes bacterium]